MFSGEPGLAGARDSEPQHGATYAAHLRRGPTSDLHPDAPGLVSPFREQRAVSAGGEAGV